MLEYLKAKREALGAKKIEPSIVYEDLERKIEEYRSKLYAEKDAEVTEHNKLIDAQVAILDEVIEETEKAMETEIEAEIAVETVDSDTEQKEVEY